MRRPLLSTAFLRWAAAETAGRPAGGALVLAFCLSKKGVSVFALSRPASIRTRNGAACSGASWGPWYQVGAANSVANFVDGFLQAAMPAQSPGLRRWCFQTPNNIYSFFRFKRFSRSVPWRFRFYIAVTSCLSPLAHGFTAASGCLRSSRGLFRPIISQRFVDFAGDPQAMQEHGQLACHRHNRALLGALAAAFGQV